MRTLLIWGAGDQGVVTLDCALDQKKYDKIDFLEIKEKKSRRIPGYMIQKEEADTLRKKLLSYDDVIVATGNNTLREEKTALLTALGLSPTTIIHPASVVSPFASISNGCTILANAVISPYARIGVGCIVNTGAIVEHDCVIGDYVNISPRAAMAGHTRIGRKSFLGIGCSVIDNIQVGENVIIGGGAVVIRDIPDGTMAAGVPAEIKKTKNS